MAQDRRRHAVWGRAAIILVMVVGAFVAARPALARSYTIDQVDIVAVLDQAGTLSVREEREFDFDGSFNGVYWNLPKGSYQGRSIEPVVTGVGEMVDGGYVAYDLSESGANHSYQLIEYPGYVQVKVFTAHEDESARVVVSYDDADLATRYDDTGELYWKFVSDGWDEESENVTCTVRLPVPDGTAVEPGENVRAWGHGPLDAEVGFAGNEVVYSVPGVGTDEFAEARITFPAEWLSGVAPTGTSALPGILAEEEAWAQEANERRASARAIVGGVFAFGLAISILTLVVALLRRRAYRQAHRARFDDEYFRDVPSADHPAVLGALYHGGSPESSDLTASLMRLTDMGVVTLEPVRLAQRGRLGRMKESDDYRITLTGRPIEGDGDRNAHDIDVKTADFMFRNLARHARRDKYAEGIETGDDVLYFSEIERIAKREPEFYHDSYENWEAKVEAACAQRQFYIDDQKVGRGPVIAMGVLSVVVGILAFLALLGFGAGLLAIVAIVTCEGAGIAAFVISAGMRGVSREAIELKAQLEALRRWLKDFTRLGEAVPNDVVLWNRLLVMATVLGVAKEVIDQLKMVAPQILESDAMMPVYGWYHYGMGHSLPASAFDDAMSSAHSVSMAALASSSDSDGGGGGGGFSSGGGGGFGGGGGGGAF